MNKKCILIAGPTAVGKTEIAIQIAKHFSTKIISADSRQCYKELNIGVAKPSEKELSTIQHFFINTHSIQESINAVDFESYALNSINEIFVDNDIAVMVGGTGLYIKAFCEGLDVIPPVSADIRQMIMDNYQENGLVWMQEMLQKNDPIFAEVGNMQNPQRMMRALEVMLSSGNSISTYQLNKQKTREFEIVKIGLELPRPELYSRINDRVDNMVDAGLVAEVENLCAFKSLNALQTVGYKELFDYFENKCSLDQSIFLIQQNTRHYAKRQMTWFKKDTNITWVYPDVDNIIRHLDTIV